MPRKEIEQEFVGSEEQSDGSTRHAAFLANFLPVPFLRELKKSAKGKLNGKAKFAKCRGDL